MLRRAFAPQGIQQTFSAVRSPLTRGFSASRPAYDENKMFNKILIANRGEIACRVIRTARRMGVRTVAVYSEADANSMHVQMADEAFLIGPPPAKESYLLGDTILKVAKKSSAQGIHPGYGFLSENAKFATKCKSSDIVFIGPPVPAIEAMGSKSASKDIMIKAGVPVVPGYHGENQDMDHLVKEADRIGYPLMIKAWMGGGGKGMRIIRSKAELVEGIQSAKREAISSFGDDMVLMERYLERPRHIEFQVFADTHGNCVYLFERDCSLQRRHQKVIEEAPAPHMTPEQRKLMGEAAVNAAKAVGYVGAGTVEFIVDEDGTFYFMEMNTRLQVEHPVTEMIVKQDLVEWQLKVASGHRLPLLQDQLSIHGHAMEARIYAENPDMNFLPGTGRLAHLSTPPTSEYVRIDTGVRQGDEVSVYYDPMIAKLVVWDTNRDRARMRLYHALDDYKIVGLHTNIKFMKKTLLHKEFAAGNVDTKFIQNYKDELLPPKPEIPKCSIALTALFQLLQDNQVATTGQKDPWALLRDRRFNHGGNRVLTFKDEERELVATVSPTGKDLYSVSVKATGEKEGTTFKVSGKLQEDGCTLKATLDNRLCTTTVVKHGNDFHIFTDGEVYVVSQPEPSYATSSVQKGSLLSPMPGRIIQVKVKEGSQVKAGDTLMVLEAMKMEHKIVADGDGTVASVHYREGDLVEEKKVLITMADAESS